MTKEVIQLKEIHLLLLLISPPIDGRSSYPELDKGGALQISVQAFQVDYYPYHLAKSDRSHWAK